MTSACYCSMILNIVHGCEGDICFRQESGCNSRRTYHIQIKAVSRNSAHKLLHPRRRWRSDLLVHRMGRGLADGITQGGAGPDEFRTAPLWGVGQRIFFLHDGRTTNLVEAIEDHQSPGSEANQVIERFRRLHAQAQQDIINFLRSL